MLGGHTHARTCFLDHLPAPLAKAEVTGGTFHRPLQIPRIPLGTSVGVDSGVDGTFWKQT